MLFSYIFLHASTFQQDLPTGLLLCIVPAILGWLAAYAYYVLPLKTKIAELTTANNSLNAKVAEQTEEITNLRVKHTQDEAEIYTRGETIKKLKNDLIICESDKTVLQNKMTEKGGSAKSAAAAPAQTITFLGAKYKWDDLKIVEGIGPKIADLLHADGIKTWTALSEASPEHLREVLDAAGPNYNIHEPATWPEQARLAQAGDWDGLKKLQEELDGGRAV